MVLSGVLKVFNASVRAVSPNVNVVVALLVIDSVSLVTSIRPGHKNALAHDLCPACIRTCTTTHICPEVWQYFARHQLAMPSIVRLNTIRATSLYQHYRDWCHSSHSHLASNTVLSSYPLLSSLQFCFL